MTPRWCACPKALAKRCPNPSTTLSESRWAATQYGVRGWPVSHSSAIHGWPAAVRPTSSTVTMSGCCSKPAVRASARKRCSSSWAWCGSAAWRISLMATIWPEAPSSASHTSAMAPEPTGRTSLKGPAASPAFIRQTPPRAQPDQAAAGRRLAKTLPIANTSSAPATPAPYRTEASTSGVASLAVAASRGM